MKTAPEPEKKDETASVSSESSEEEEEDACEHCGDPCLTDELIQTSNGFYCEWCYKERCCEVCSEDMDGYYKFSELDPNRILCSGCYDEELADAVEDEEDEEEA